MKTKSRIAATAVSLGFMLFSFNHCVLDQKINTKNPSTTSTTDPVPVEESSNLPNDGNHSDGIGDQIGDTPTPTPDPIQPPPDVIQAQEIDVGIKNFEQINATMSVLTGVSSMNNAIRNTYNDLEVQLPTSNNVKSFLAANQVAITKLAAEYCDALVNSSTLRQNIWPGFNFGGTPNAVLSSNGQKSSVVNQTLNGFWGSNVGGDRSFFQLELQDLINDLLAGENLGSATTTRTTMKGVCTAALASAPVTIL